MPYENGQIWLYSYGHFHMAVAIYSHIHMAILIWFYSWLYHMEVFIWLPFLIKSSVWLLQDAWIWWKCHSWLGGSSETTQRFLANMDHTGGGRYAKLNPILLCWLTSKNVSFSDTCTGTEASIEECHEPALWEHYDECKHSEDVVLSCTVRGTK